jgi:hypothetical protein
MIEWTAWEHCRKHRFLDRACPVNAQGLAQLRKWLKVAPAVSIYSYLDYRYMEIPEPFLASDEDFYRTLHGLGVRHVADELDTTPYASPVLLGLRARLLWDVNTHAEDYLDRFCRIAYGDAAEDMKQFWQFQEQAVYNSPTAHPTVNDLARYTPTVLLRSKRLLRQALDRPLTDVTSPSSLIPHPSSLTAEQRARVERAWMSLLFAEFYVAQEKAPSGDMAVWERLARSKRQILDLARRYGFTLNLYAHNALGGNYELPLAALGGKTLVSLPDEWLFRTDPEGRGEQERWFDPAAKLDSFRPISTSKNWEAQWVGAYDGTAWYVTEVIIPATEVKHVWLLFGAVDETWKVWLNGDYIGASTGDPGEIWDKPTAIEITGKYPSGQKVRLVVKVHDIGYAGGIWRPVRITASD